VEGGSDLSLRSILEKRLLQGRNFPQAFYQLNNPPGHIINLSFGVETSDAKADGASGSFVA
jgi:hypothetical protein